MKKLMVLTALLFWLSTNALSAVLSVESYGVYSAGGSKAYQWDILIDANNMTYNSQSGYWETNATHTGQAWLATMVIADSFSDIDKLPIAGTGGGDADFDSSEDGYMNGKPARIFYFFSPSQYTSGLYKSFYSYGSTVLSSMDKFLQYP